MKHPRPAKAEAAAQRWILIIRLGFVPMFSAKLERYCSTLDTHTSGGGKVVPVLASSYWLGIWLYWTIMSRSLSGTAEQRICYTEMLGSRCDLLAIGYDHGSGTDQKST